MGTSTVVLAAGNLFLDDVLVFVGQFVGTNITLLVLHRCGWYFAARVRYRQRRVPWSLSADFLHSKTERRVLPRLCPEHTPPCHTSLLCPTAWQLGTTTPTASTSEPKGSGRRHGRWVGGKTTWRGVLPLPECLLEDPLCPIVAVVAVYDRFGILGGESVAFPRRQGGPVDHLSRRNVR